MERISKALKKDKKLMDSAKAALEIFNAAVSKPIKIKDTEYKSWATLDKAFKNVLNEQVSSAVLRRLFKHAISAAVKIFMKGGK